MLDRSKIFAVTLLAAAFVAGGAIGTAVALGWGDGDDGRSRQGRERLSYTERLDRALGFTEAQRESVRVILDRRQAAMRDIWRDAEPRFDSLRMQIRQEILAVLDSAQQAEYTKLITRSDSARDPRQGRGSRGRDSDGRK